MPSRAGRTSRAARDRGPLLPFDRPAAAGPRRVFLGWERPILHSAARWILSELGTELGDVLVAVPGARAALRLRELLAEQAPMAWTPPRVLTQGELIDELVQLERPPAGRVARTLVWERALEGISEKEHERLGRARAGAEPLERLRLAETVRALHGELAPEGRDFAALAAGDWPEDLEAEAQRWQALGFAQDRYRTLLTQLGLADPHEDRAHAIDQGKVDGSRRVVLVGVADMNQLLARLVQAIAPRVSVLVAAPESLAEGFDELGRLHTPFWGERDIPLAIENWRVAEKPVDQAETLRDLLEEWRGTLTADELTVGVADESVVPYVERQLNECGAGTRQAAGTPVEVTRPYRLLQALARLLRRGGFTELATLARDPDLGARLASGGDPTPQFDAYFNEHLPRLARDWIGERSFESAVRGFQEQLERSLGDIAPGRTRPLAAWCEPIRRWLAQVYPRSLSGESETERVLAEALRRTASVLAEFEEVPASLELSEVTAADALELLLRSLGGQRIPPPERSGSDTVELVGWLDLPFDDGPALVLLGFNEGRIPQSTRAHAFLPDSLRRRLGLVGDAERLARDAYAATVVLSTRERCAFVSARRSKDGDPLVPSRLAFHRPEGEIPSRVARFLPAEEGHTVTLVEEGPNVHHACPVLPGWTVPKRLSVSAFRAYLSSPYTFYLQQILRLDTRDDRTNELDPRRFGILAHAVLQDFGQEGPHASGDAEEVEAFLVGALRRRAAAEFGASPLPAVGLQIEQLEYRLKAFAPRQAERAAEGWRIHAVEWKPPTPVRLDVDGEPMEIAAKIDRIDRHEDGRWAILDYKTGEKKRAPKEAHRKRNGDWIDLQLPLYHFVSGAMGFSGEPELGYAWIGKDEAETGFFVDPWAKAEHEEALEVARHVVRQVRLGAFDEVGRLPYDEIMKAICGVSALGQESGERSE